MTNWLILGLLAILSTSLFDFFLKLATGKIPPPLAGAITQLFGTVIPLLFLIFGPRQTQLAFGSETTPKGLVFASLAGVAAGGTSLLYYGIYLRGVNMSIAVPLVKASSVALSVAIGVLALREGLNFRTAAGIVMVIFGLYLLAWQR